LVVLYFFFDGIGDQSVSSFNIGIWLLLLAGVAIPMVAGGILKARGNFTGAAIVFAMLAVPGCLMGWFFLVLIVLPASYH
jgi:hypothetical protein